MRPGNGVCKSLCIVTVRLDTRESLRTHVIELSVVIDLTFVQIELLWVDPWLCDQSFTLIIVLIVVG